MGDADVYTLRDGKTVRVQGEHRLRQVDMVSSLVKQSSG